MTRRTRCGQTGATAVNRGVSHKLHCSKSRTLKTQKAQGFGRGAPVFIVIRVITCVDVVDSEYDLLLTGACSMHTKVVVKCCLVKGWTVSDLEPCEGKMSNTLQLVASDSRAAVA